MTNLSASNKILFYQRALALWGNWGSQHTLHTFANHTCRLTNRNLQKSAIFAIALNLSIYSNFIEQPYVERQRNQY